MTTYDCMTEEEFALWSQNKYGREWRRPCVDCPMAYHLEMLAQDRCNSVPGSGRPISAVPDERRAQWRESSKRKRARDKAARSRQADRRTMMWSA